jgi:prepilin-type N-terminal cleavage/methylation domain-containing protein
MQVCIIPSSRRIARSGRAALDEAMHLNILGFVPPPHRQRGFTLIELLVVIAILAILAGLLWPALARARQKATQAACMSNMKQLGHALQMYTDDNSDSLPGPCFTGARASYDKTSGTELIYYIANYLGSPSPSWVTGKPIVVEVFVCPGYRRLAPSVTSMEGRKCYLLNDDIDPNPNRRIQPFGYPEFNNADEIPPLKFSAIYTYGTPAALFAITDVDKINIPNPQIDWWSDLPYKPVHGDMRNELYFDWHVAAKRAW